MNSFLDFIHFKRSSDNLHPTKNDVSSDSTKFVLETFIESLQNTGLTQVSMHYFGIKISDFIFIC